LQNLHLMCFRLKNLLLLWVEHIIFFFRIWNGVFFSSIFIFLSAAWFVMLNSYLNLIIWISWLHIWVCSHWIISPHFFLLVDSSMGILNPSTTKQQPTSVWHDTDPCYCCCGCCCCGCYCCVGSSCLKIYYKIF